MPSAQPASGSEPRLEPNDPSWRDRLRWALQDGLTGMGMKQGLAQMYGDHLVGSPMGGGVAAADLVPGIGQGLSANEASRSYDRGDLAGALLHGIGALPLGTMAAGAKTAVRAALPELTSAGAFASKAELGRMKMFQGGHKLDLAPREAEVVPAVRETAEELEAKLAQMIDPRYADVPAVETAGSKTGPTMQSKALRSRRGSTETEPLAQRSIDLHNPPEVRARQFGEDYTLEKFPDGTVPVTADGRLRATQDGDPLSLSAPFVVGRQQYGGPNVALAPDQVSELAKRLTPGGIVPIDPAKLDRAIPGASGAFYPKDAVRPGHAPLIVAAEDLARSDFEKVGAHEVGHALDLTRAADPSAPASFMSSAGAAPNTEAHLLYEYLNGASPLAHGYKEVNVPHELAAEGIRSYMANPDFVKTHTPGLAEAIRKYVNPRFPDLIQFNSVAPIAAGGGAAALAAPSIADLYGPKQQ